MSAEHRDWRAQYDDGEGCWRVARTDADGREIYGGQTGIEGAPYRCCCEQNARSLAKSMNTVGHP
ncbi:hypothetical protein V3391_06565 [Luteimonas sp. SMYT11W]|uniref:DUF2188 domain-containing protein n=1 Tax=Luteimonas flava TaxID=3115822 RepID=A0ABU7WE02_9GAMM